MVLLRSIPMLLAMLTLAAHFMRWGQMTLVLVVLALPAAALVIWKRWSMRAMQLVLVLAAGEWVYTAVTIWHQRQQTGQPWVRMAVILGSVAAFNLLAAIVLPLPRKGQI